jgi:exodeoxyribonuclease V beta subunit
MIAEPFDVLGCELKGTQLIEASAGTGKTWTLCALYLRLLLEQRLEVSQILVVTFTNAATAELRERVRSRIVQTLAVQRGLAEGDAFVRGLLQRLRSSAGNEDLATEIETRLQLALHSFDEAAIFTIHGFCQRALAEAPFSAGLPLTLNLLQDDSPLRLQVVRDFWRRHMAGEALNDALADHLLEKKESPDKLSALLQRRLAKPLAKLLWPDALDQALQPGDPVALQQAFEATRGAWQADRERIVAQVVAGLGSLNKARYSSATVELAAAQWDTWLAAGDACMAIDKPDKLKLLASDTLRPNKGQRPIAHHAFHELAQTLLTLREAHDNALALQRLALQRELLQDSPQALQQLKNAQRLTAFDDMLSNLYRRLVADDGEALAQRLRLRFRAALIDEFQDTDPQQYEIFRRIHGQGAAPLFLVGDPKQAIYGFRHADLYTYLQAQEAADSVRTLRRNQRSTPELIGALNGLFGTNPQAFVLSGLHYREVGVGDKRPAPLHDRSGVQRAALQLWQLPDAEDGRPLLKKQARLASAQATAGEIARLLTAARVGEVTIGERALAAGDIAVLVRSHAHGRLMRRALARVGVASVELSQASIFASADADELARLLAAVLEPARLPLLRAALGTVLLGLDAAQLDALADDEAALQQQVVRFAGWRALWLERGIGPLLRHLGQAEGVNRQLLARSDGERRLTNYRHLAECLHEAEAEHATPEALHRWLQAQQADPLDDAAQLRLESDSELVQVVTIHKSKGLEYPLVFCPLLWDGRAPPSPTGPGREYHDDAGQAVIDMRSLADAEAKRIGERIALDKAAETMRLIYVALTRAVHRCHLVVGCYANKTTNDQSPTESCRSRLNSLAAGAGLTAQAWAEHKLQPADIGAAWTALAEQHAPHIALQALPLGTPYVLAAQPVDLQRFAALPPPAHIGHGWWIGSYSSLAHGARHEGAALDHDAAAALQPQPADDAVADDDILRYPRGPAAGDSLHAVFESIDFADAAGWPAAVQSVLRRHAPALGGSDSLALQAQRVLNMLHAVLAAPLPDGLRLACVTPQQRRNELEFHLPAHRVDAAALGALLRQAAPASAVPTFGRLDGYLHGYIDLVCQQAGRWYVVDWKSNHLGSSAVGYAPPALAQVMDAMGYRLQALLYALALHRLLRARLPGYNHEQHFGGVHYLFVRGLRPGWQADDGAPCGAYFERPSLDLLQRLSALFDGSEGGR